MKVNLTNQSFYGTDNDSVSFMIDGLKLEELKNLCLFYILKSNEVLQPVMTIIGTDFVFDFLQENFKVVKCDSDRSFKKIDLDLLTEPPTKFSYKNGKESALYKKYNFEWGDKVKKNILHHFSLGKIAIPLEYVSEIDFNEVDFSLDCFVQFLYCYDSVSGVFYNDKFKLDLLADVFKDSIVYQVGFKRSGRQYITGFINKNDSRFKQFMESAILSHNQESEIFFKENGYYPQIHDLFEVWGKNEVVDFQICFPKKEV